MCVYVCVCAYAPACVSERQRYTSACRSLSQAAVYRLGEQEKRKDTTNMLPVDCKICFSSKPAVQNLEYSFNIVFKATLFWTIKLMHALQKNLKAKQNVNRKIKITLNLAIMVAYFSLVYLCFKFLFPTFSFLFLSLNLFLPNNISKRREILPYNLSFLFFAVYIYELLTSQD